MVRRGLTAEQAGLRNEEIFTAVEETNLVIGLFLPDRVVQQLGRYDGSPDRVDLEPKDVGGHFDYRLPASHCRLALIRGVARKRLRLWQIAGGWWSFLW
jgi:hypothetical protein